MNNIFKTVKKTVAVLITAAMLLCAFAVIAVSAATNPTVTLTCRTSGSLNSHATCDIAGYTSDKPIDYMQISISCSNYSLKDVLLNVKNLVNNSKMDFSYAYDTLNNALVFIYEPNTAGDVYIPTDTKNLFEFDLNSSAYKVDLNLTIKTIFCYTDGTDAETSSNITFASTYLGDVNADGKIDLLDLLRYKLYLAGKSVNFRTVNGDLNADKTYNANDISLLIQFLLGEITF